MQQYSNNTAGKVSKVEPIQSLLLPLVAFLFCLYSYLLYGSCFPSCMDIKAKKMRLTVILCGVSCKGRY